MRTGTIGEGTFTYTWSFPICPHKVSIDLSIIEALQVELSAGSDHRQGLLYGNIANGVTHVDDWQALPALTSDEFSAAIPAARRQVAGYYTIREGSAFILSPAEVAIANAHFRPGSVVLLVERRKRGPAEATFYFWRGDVFVHNLPLPFPFHAGLLSGQGPGALAPPPRRIGTRRVFRTALMAGGAVVAGVLFAAYLRDGRSLAVRPAAVEMGPPSAAAVWIPTEPRRDLELTWESQRDVVADATTGVLKIEDGGVTRQMTLDKGELLVGSVLYAPASDRIRVELLVQRNGRTMPLTVASKAPDLSSPVPAPLPPATPSKDDILVEAVVVKPAEKAAAAVRPALKRFTWTGADRVVAPAPAADNLPQAAPAPLTPPLLSGNLPPAALPAPAPPPAPPPKAAAPVKTAVAHSGRLIWTGTLQRRGIVELDGRTASLGSVNGALPGVPVNLSITPAEFGEDGLLVYTTDAKRHNRVEPPSASNGWNKITFVWDPERVKQIEVLEAPNPNNSFSRLALRSDARRCSLLFIDWTVRQ